MPPNGKCKVNRLPKSERHEATNKVTMLPPPEQIPPSTPTTPTAVDTRTRMSNLLIDEQSSTIPSLPNLPDELLLKILQHLPTDAVLTCSKLSNQFQRIAHITLTTKPAYRYVNFNRFFIAMKRRYPVLSTFSHWSRFVMLDALQTIPRLESLNICFAARQHCNVARNDILFPQCVELFCSTYASPLLQNVVICAMEVSFPLLQSLLTHCPNIQTLSLSSHHSINHALCTKLANLGKQFVQQNPSKRRLNSLIIQHTAHVNGISIRHLILSCLSQSISIKSLPAVNALHVQNTQPSPQDAFPFAVHSLTAHHCTHLSVTVFERHGHINDPVEINLPQCRALRKVLFTTRCDTTHNPSDHRPRNLRKLNLSGCSSLTEVLAACINDSANGELTTLNSTENSFADLEELNLFGARSLRFPTFARTFGLCASDDGIVMPQLKVLNLNGTAIERVILNGYPHLTTVDLSGSALQELSIIMCPSLLSVSVLGANMDLRRVDVVVPLACSVVWSQNGWKWEQYATYKAYTYP